MVKAKVCGGKENNTRLTNNRQRNKTTASKKRRNHSQKNGYGSLYRPTILQPPSAGCEGVRNEDGRGVRGLDRTKLVAILKSYGEYPAKYRALIWRSLLQLPGNHTAYGALLERGTHPVYANLHRDYPIKSQRLARVLQRYRSSRHTHLHNLFLPKSTHYQLLPQGPVSSGSLVPDICRDTLPPCTGLSLREDVPKQPTSHL